MSDRYDEFRTPLTCIAGFSELLTEPGAELGAVEAGWARAIAESAADLLAALERYAGVPTSDGS
jgi:hypothetical protein